MTCGESRYDAPRLAAPLQERGYQVASVTLDDRPSAVAAKMATLFDGCPPDVILADLSAARDCLPLAHAQRVMATVWGEGHTTPLVVALFDTCHLDQPEWRAYTDDFLLPPFQPAEIEARVSLLLFRHRHVQPQNTIALPGITIHLSSSSVTDENGRLVPTTPREFDLLRFLAEHRGRLFPRERLLDLVWGVNFDGGERTVDIHVRRLRAKLPSQTALLLRTQRGRGYGIDCD